MIIEVVGAIILDAKGRLLTVRKRGTERFMLPGGKPEPGETDEVALVRELQEELGVAIRSSGALGMFEAPAANEPNALVRSRAYFVELAGEITIGSEIDAMLWIDPAEPPDGPIAPLLTGQILPALIARRAATRAGSR